MVPTHSYNTHVFTYTYERSILIHPYEVRLHIYRTTFQSRLKLMDFLKSQTSNTINLAYSILL